jgi:peptidoglycan/xylan/chitin deacetylase (PgdA/CDA1 family)
MAQAKAQTPAIPLTFFEIGQNVVANPGVSLSVKNAGFVIADHTNTHPDATTEDDATITQEAMSAYTAISNAAGVKPRYFRPPYGAFSPSSMTDWYNLGFYVITWSIYSDDFEDPANADAAYNNIAAQLALDNTSGHIVLCHDIHSACKDAFPRIVTLFKSNGYTFVDMQTCLGITSLTPYR